MAKIQAVWAIDIGQAALKALKLTPGEDPEKLNAEAFDFIEYPKILSQPDADAEELVREALATFLGRNDLKGCGVAIGVSAQAGLVKFIKLPPVEKKRIPDIVKFEARQQIPFALEEVIWDYQAIGGDEEGEEDISMTEVGLFAMKRDQINRAILPLKAAGIEVDVVQMGPIALYNYIAFDNPPPKAESADGANSYVLLDIGADNTDLIITDGIRIWQRNVPIGGNHFTRALTKELKLTFAKAEHLKRNATKAQDPRAVFTAMRGIFNDFSSEVSRSIGFYSSVNRNAKIVKIIGLGNGFKLPGLQKFLQQNLNQEVEKLDGFPRLVGDEVLSAPQFQENLSSFPVSYGLAVQGLGLGPLHTNLLPPEIEQARMIRRKKPWALAASTLLMLGFSAMFVSSWHALAKTKPLEAPAKQAKTVAEQGKRYESEFEEAKGEFTGIVEKGKSLVGEETERTNWPALLQTVMATLPNPGQELQQQEKGFDPTDPKNAPLIGILRVHVDKIVPIWREDLKTGWYDTLEQEWVNTMHAYDREKPPEGSGWVVQIVGHHYNPSPLSRKEELEKSPLLQKYARGTWQYIQYEILPRFFDAKLRLAGIHHAALTMYYVESKWTTEMGASNVPLPKMLEKEQPPVETADMGGGAGAGMMPGMSQMMAMMGAQGGMGPEGAGAMAGMPGMMPGMGMKPGMGMMPGMGMPQGKKNEDITTLTRTDFKIDFVWQPPKPEETPKTPEEAQEKLAELRKSMQEVAEKSKGSVRARAFDVTKLQELSLKESEEAKTKALQQIQQAIQKAAPADGQPAEGGAPAPDAAGEAEK